MVEPPHGNSTPAVKLDHRTFHMSNDVEGPNTVIVRGELLCGQQVSWGGGSSIAMVESLPYRDVAGGGSAIPRGVVPCFRGTAMLQGTCHAEWALPCCLGLCHAEGCSTMLLGSSAMLLPGFPENLYIYIFNILNPPKQ